MKNTDYEQLQAAYERLHNDYSYLFSQYENIKAKADELEKLALKKDMKIWEMQLEISKLK